MNPFCLYCLFINYSSSINYSSINYSVQPAENSPGWLLAWQCWLLAGKYQFSARLGHQHSPLASSVCLPVLLRMQTLPRVKLGQVGAFKVCRLAKGAFFAEGTVTGHKDSGQGGVHQVKR
jgi:hypothetical protein